jgi:hypothetical protein
VEGSCEDGNEPFGSTKYWEVLQYLSDWRLLKKDSASWNWLITECIRFELLAAVVMKNSTSGI